MTETLVRSLDTAGPNALTSGWYTIDRAVYVSSRASGFGGENSVCRPTRRRLRPAADQPSLPVIPTITGIQMPLFPSAPPQ